MRRARWALLTMSCVSGSALLAGCDGLLDVENVTAIEADDLRNAQSAEIWTNGAQAAAQEAWDRTLVLLSWASDEWTWVGPHGWWGELDLGRIDAPDNAGLETAYDEVASAHWFTNEAIELLDSLQQAGALGDPTLLSRAYLYGAVVHMSIADAFEDYAPSDLTEAGPPLGPENMSSLYDVAVRYATDGLTLSPPTRLRRDLLAIRARAHHGRQVWSRVRPPPADVSGGGLLASSEAAADALAALAEDGSDWRMEFDYPAFVTPSLAIGLMNCIVNAAPGARYAVPGGGQPGGQVRADSVVLLDPVDGTADASVARYIDEALYVEGECQTGRLTVTSAREMRLIVAEDALAGGDTATFETQINVTRAAEGVSDWTAASGVSGRDMLIYERQARLYVTGRRLLDMYRFGLASDGWDPASVVATTPGSLYPIAQSEVDANCYLNGSCGG